MAISAPCLRLPSHHFCQKVKNLFSSKLPLIPPTLPLIPPAPRTCSNLARHSGSCLDSHKESSKENLGRIHRAAFHSLHSTHRAKHKSTAKRAKSLSFRPDAHPEDTSILLFPGQGSQFVGMGQKLVEEYPKTRDMFDAASHILGYDLLHLCLHGPQSKLDQTRFSQAAVVVASLAAVDKLRAMNPDAVDSCIGAAGFSVGEISALIFSGAISFQDGIRLVKVRANEMQIASEQQHSAMATCFLSHASRLDLALETAKEWCIQKHMISQPVCQTANFLYQECKVIAGHAEAVDFIKTHKSKFAIKRLKSLPVSGAFHTSLMSPAKEKFAKALSHITIEPPVVPVYSNVNNTFYRNPEEIRSLLLTQLTSPVRWEQLMHILYARDFGVPFPITYEVGPGTQLGSMLYMNNRKAHENYMSIDV